MKRLLLASLSALTLLAGCATTGGATHPRDARHFDFFGAAVPNDDKTDPWYPKVVEWQGRMQKEGNRLPPSNMSLRAADQTGKLLNEMDAYRDDQRVELAKRVTDWSQHMARRFYKWDPGDNDPRWDHWPTVGELLSTNGDDCDGLDLIAYQMLREFGFPADHVFRAVVRRDRDKANHMVTLWFQDPKDPWVLDATGAITFAMRHFSELEGWTPTKVFNENGQYLAIESPRPAAVARGE
jgi:predicted transglutaminase-like cysteine proteinase